MTGYSNARPSGSCFEIGEPDVITQLLHAMPAHRLSDNSANLQTSQSQAAAVRRRSEASAQNCGHLTFSARFHENLSGAVLVSPNGHMRIRR
jgi:hypothetical protein